MKANKGAPGIDSMTVEDFPAFSRVHWPRIATAIREGNYRPASVKRVWIIRFIEGRLQLVVNRAKSHAAPLKSCEFLGYRLNSRGKLAWTAKAHHRFKERIREWERSGHRLPEGEPREG